MAIQVPRRCRQQAARHEECGEALSHVLWADDLGLLATKQNEFVDRTRAPGMIKFPPTKASVWTTAEHVAGILRTKLGGLRAEEERDLLRVILSLDRRGAGRN